MKYRNFLIQVIGFAGFLIQEKTCILVPFNWRDTCFTVEWTTNGYGHNFKYVTSMRQVWEILDNINVAANRWARPLGTMASMTTGVGAGIIVKQICCIWAGPARLGQRMRGEWSNGFAHILCYVERMNMCVTRMKNNYNSWWARPLPGCLHDRSGGRRIWESAHG